MDYDEKLKKSRELDNEIQARYQGKKVVRDGIVDFDDYGFENAPKKILWILKEVNLGNAEIKGNYFDLCDYLLHELKVKDVPFRTTWKLVFEISFAIMNNAQIWEKDVPDGEVLFKEGIMKQLAVIEVKKLFGGSSSDKGDINSYYENDKDIIMAQIDAIEPDIIINASRVDALFNDIKTGESQLVQPFCVAKFKGGIIINAYHPNQKDFSHERYFELIRDCIKAVS